MPESSELLALARLAGDPETLRKVGHEILADAVRNAAEAKLGGKPRDPSVRLVLRRGDPIPSSLRGLPGLRLADDTVGADWERTWTDLGPWERSWHESESVALGGRPGLSRFRFALRARAVLDPEELAVVERLGVLSE